MDNLNQFTVMRYDIVYVTEKPHMSSIDYDHSFCSQDRTRTCMESSICTTLQNHLRLGLASTPTYSRLASIQFRHLTICCLSSCHQLWWAHLIVLTTQHLRLTLLVVRTGFEPASPIPIWGVPLRHLTIFYNSAICWTQRASHNLNMDCPCQPAK